MGPDTRLTISGVNSYEWSPAEGQKYQVGSCFFLLPSFIETNEQETNENFFFSKQLGLLTG